MYFDYAATTPPHAEVLKTFETVNRDFWSNPHALHYAGIRAEALLEQARLQTLTLLNATETYQCLFTSGATEANNTALKGIRQHSYGRGNHLITSEAEHPSVLEVCRHLEQQGMQLTLLPINNDGTVEPHALKAALRPETVMVSLMHVNNETGAINNVAQLGQIIKENSKAFFHVDAAQSIGKLPLSLHNSPIDLLSFSAHKFHGLKGSGGLLVKKAIALPPLLHGGGQEKGMRSGTVDVASAAALAKALRLATASAEEALPRIRNYKQQIASTLQSLPYTMLNGDIENASPYILNISIDGVRSETLLQALSEKEIYISTVSACSTRKIAESTVVFALSGSHERAQSSIRISLSSQTTQDEVDLLCQTLPPLISSLRLN